MTPMHAGMPRSAIADPPRFAPAEREIRAQEPTK